MQAGEVNKAGMYQTRLNAAQPAFIGRPSRLMMGHLPATRVHGDSGGLSVVMTGHLFQPHESMEVVVPLLLWTDVVLYHSFINLKCPYQKGSL